jgi:hypothetical protein
MLTSSQDEDVWLLFISEDRIIRVTRGLNAKGKSERMDKYDTSVGAVAG